MTTRTVAAVRRPTILLAAIAVALLAVICVPETAAAQQATCAPAPSPITFDIPDAARDTIIAEHAFAAAPGQAFKVTVISTNNHASNSRGIIGNWAIDLDLNDSDGNLIDRGFPYNTPFYWDTATQITNEGVITNKSDATRVVLVIKHMVRVVTDNASDTLTFETVPGTCTPTSPDTDPAPGSDGGISNPDDDQPLVSRELPFCGEQDDNTLVENCTTEWTEDQQPGWVINETRTIEFDYIHDGALLPNALYLIPTDNERFELHLGDGTKIDPDEDPAAWRTESFNRRINIFSGSSSSNTPDVTVEVDSPFVLAVDTGRNIFYTYSRLNESNVQHRTFRSRTNPSYWQIGFEDTNAGAGDNDFDDLTITMNLLPAGTEPAEDGGGLILYTPLEGTTEGPLDRVDDEIGPGNFRHAPPTFEGRDDARRFDRPDGVSPTLLCGSDLLWRNKRPENIERYMDGEAFVEFSLPVNPDFGVVLLDAWIQDTIQAVPPFAIPPNRTQDLESPGSLPEFSKVLVLLDYYTGSGYMAVNSTTWSYGFDEFMVGARHPARFSLTDGDNRIWEDGLPDGLRRVRVHANISTPANLIAQDTLVPTIDFQIYINPFDKAPGRDGSFDEGDGEVTFWGDSYPTYAVFRSRSCQTELMSNEANLIMSRPQGPVQAVLNLPAVRRFAYPEPFEEGRTSSPYDGTLAHLIHRCQYETFYEARPQVCERYGQP